MRELFFTSDTHFGHRRMAEEWRSLGSKDEMDEFLIQRWNETVAPTDEVWHLGDFSFANRAAIEAVLDRLHGVIHLVWGNHDKREMRRVAHRFASVQHYKELKMDGRRIVLFHFPIESWYDVHHGAWHLHGHCHGNLPETDMARMDVGVDTNDDLRPYHWDEIVQYMEGRQGLPNDHHGTHGELNRLVV